MRPFKSSTVQRFNVLESREIHSVPSLGSSFIDGLKSELGFKAAHPAAFRPFNSSKVQTFNVTGLFGPQINCTYALREQSEAYGSNFTGKMGR